MTATQFPRTAAEPSMAPEPRMAPRLAPRLRVPARKPGAPAPR